MSRKIMHIITGLNKGGAEMLLLNYLSSTSHERSLLTVVSLTDGGVLRDQIEALGVPVYSLGMRRGVPSIASLFRLYKIIRVYKPNVIQGWMYHANLYAILAAKMCTAKPLLFMAIFHCIDDLSSKKMLLRIVVKLGAVLSRYVDGIVNNSHKSVTQHEKIGYVSDRTTIIHNGIDTRTFCPDAEAYKSVRDELGVSSNTFLIGLVGRFDPLKDHCNFLDAAEIVARTYKNVRFLLVGRGVDNENADLSNKIEELGLGDKVFMLGERSDIPRLMASLDVSVSSSVSEGMPVAIGESMSCCVPCVVTDVGDSSLLVGDTGLSVPPSDSVALAHSIIHLLMLPKEERDAIGHRARLRVVNNYSLESFVDKFESLYCSQS